MILKEPYQKKKKTTPKKAFFFILKLSFITLRGSTMLINSG